MATSSHSSICIVERSKETHHHPQKVWRPFSISVSVIGGILHPNVAMSHCCCSWFDIQFSFIPFSWNAVRDCLNFVHINSHKINLLNINLRTIGFVWVFSFLNFFFFSAQTEVNLAACNEMDCTGQKSCYQPYQWSISLSCKTNVVAELRLRT